MLLPGEQTALHIFEERYRELIRDVESMGMTFGIPYASTDDGLIYGAEVRLVQITKQYPGGESDILVECTGVFRIAEYREKDPAKLYPSGEVRMISQYDHWPAKDETMAELKQLRDALGPKAAVLDKDEFRYVPRILLSLNLSNEQKYQFVKLANAERQESSLFNMLRFSRLIVEQEQQVIDGIFPN